MVNPCLQQQGGVEVVDPHTCHLPLAIPEPSFLSSKSFVIRREKGEVPCGTMASPLPCLRWIDGKRSKKRSVVIVVIFVVISSFSVDYFLWIAGRSEVHLVGFLQFEFGLL